MADILRVDKENFKREVLEADVPVLVDFWAPWCGPCRMQAPILEELSKETDGKAKIAKLNTDENGEIASQYGIMSIPTMIIFKSGQEKERLVGVTQKEGLKQVLNKYAD